VLSEFSQKIGGMESIIWFSCLADKTTPRRLAGSPLPTATSKRLPGGCWQILEPISPCPFF